MSVDDRARREAQKGLARGRELLIRVSALEKQIELLVAIVCPSDGDSEE